MTASALCLFAVLALPAEAFAGACQKTKRDYSYTPSSSNEGEHTTAHNNTSDATFDVTINRGSTEKASKTIAPGDMVGQFAKFGDKSDDSFVDFTVVIANKSDGNAVSCAFRVKYGQSTIWDLAKDADAVCGDASVLCPECQISCDKSYHPDKQRWNTTFKITD